MSSLVVKIGDYSSHGIKMNDINSQIGNNQVPTVVIYGLDLGMGPVKDIYSYHLHFI